MKKIWFASSVLLLTWLVIYAIFYLSTDNKCTWVRVYECVKSEKKLLLKKSDPNYSIFKETSDIFLKNCMPKITTTSGSFLSDYSNCNLKVHFYKDKNWVKSVEVNWKAISREQIKANFK